MKQALFNSGGEKWITYVEENLTQPELDKINDASKELFEKAKKDLDPEHLKELAEHWSTPAKAARNAAVAITAFCTPDRTPSQEVLDTIKDSVVQALVMEKAIELIDKEFDEFSSKNKTTLDKLPGETDEEHMARLKAFILENK